MIKHHDILVIIACVVCLLMALWLLVQAVRANLSDAPHSSERLGGVIHLGDRVINANP